MYIYLPVAMTSINIFLPIGLGLVVGLLSGVFGIGGGFLLTPLLMMVGIPSTVAVATGMSQMVATSTSGAYAHYKIGNIDFKMGVYLIIGGLLGGIIGVHAIKILTGIGTADFTI
ncbi:MAG: sulfite exporter TauE/SafE family protein, partial [Nitrospirae bacterium]|nr:sulfite exporter TauE/SafE family protein [Nitrospirota bacterium]